jgi:hypothetical protein
MTMQPKTVAAIHRHLADGHSPRFLMALARSRALTRAEVEEVIATWKADTNRRQRP